MREISSQSVLAVTANRLRDGSVVYLADDLLWSENIEKAQLISDIDEASVQSLVDAAQLRNPPEFVIGAYAIEIEFGGDDLAPSPRRLRERIRAHGPTA